MTIAVRPAREADAVSIASIHVRGWRAAYRGIMPPDYLESLDVGEWTERHRGRIVAPEPGVSRWVAEEDGTVVGFAVLGPAREAFAGDAGEVYAIYVDPERWRRGAGRALLDEAVSRFRAEGRAEATLWVLRDNAAGRAFYEAVGWRPDGSEKRFVLPGYEEAELVEVRYQLRLAG